VQDVVRTNARQEKRISRERLRITASIIVKGDGVAKSPPYGVTAFFQDLDILEVCLRP
jgi:hypothetical protein